ncbi:MAG TPA: hypothetical protein VKA48_03330 [Gammaproteobacteria bacterium]|nr:hypothetical protein [Gammaproteobacteria bacterium]
MAEDIGKRGLGWLAALAAAAFGVVTLWAAAMLLFGPVSTEQVAGVFPPFLVWFDFLVGFLYLAGATGLLLRRRWAGTLAAAIAVVTAIIFAIYGLRALQGAPYEPRIVGALAGRVAFWAIMARIASWVSRI